MPHYSTFPWAPCRALMAVTAFATQGTAAPTVSRLTPPSELFHSGHPDPIIARFFRGQKFDLQATVRTDPNTTITNFQFSVDGKLVQPKPGTTAIVPATVGAPGMVVSVRGYQQPGNAVPPLNAYPNDPLQRDTAGKFLVTGQIADSVAAHTAHDIPLSACGRGAALVAGGNDG